VKINDDDDDDDFSIGNGQFREPALCQFYRHTFVPTSGRSQSKPGHKVHCAGARLSYQLDSELSSYLPGRPRRRWVGSLDHRDTADHAHLAHARTKHLPVNHSLTTPTAAPTAILTICCRHSCYRLRRTYYLAGKGANPDQFAVKGTVRLLETATTARRTTFPASYCRYAIQDGV